MNINDDKCYTFNNKKQTKINKFFVEIGHSMEYITQNAYHSAGKLIENNFVIIKY